MSEQGSPQINQSAAIMVAAGAQDERAIALVQAMRQAGLRVTFAETVNIAVRASEVAACVVVLRPDTWKTPAIATVMRTNPDCLIPVLAETMELPRGPWTHPAIQLADDPAEGQQQIIQVLRAYLETHKRQARTAPSKSADLVTINQLLNKRKRRQRRPIGVGPLITALLLIVIVGLGGLLGYRYYTSGPSRANATAGTPGPISGTAPLATYNAATPGQYCDGGGGSWGLGDRYMKTEKKKEVEVIDKYTTLQCRSNGTMLTRSGDYKDASSELFFDGIDEYTSISQNYVAQVDATITSGDAQADVFVDVHVHNNGYGRDNFDVNTPGRWEANTLSTVDASPINRLAIGFLSKGSKTYTLKVEVDGPTMTFWINSTLVTTVTDSTYPDNTAIGFGMGDWSATEPISAVFSNFKYVELTPGQLDNTELVATATAQAKTDLQTPYTAHIPGYGCDTGAGQWQPLADEDVPGTLNCLSSGMQLIAPANVKKLTTESFYWLNGYFPQNYKVSVQVDVSAASDGCAGLGTREDRKDDSYVFAICPSGSWQIALDTNTFHTLARGSINAQNSYTITAVANGSSQSLYIDGQLVKTVNDTQLTSTDHLSLYAGIFQANQSQSATFSNFVFTPLP